MKSARYEKWPWYAIAAFVAGCIYASAEQAVRGVVESVGSWRR